MDEHRTDGQTDKRGCLEKSMYDLFKFAKG